SSDLYWRRDRAGIREMPALETLALRPFRFGKRSVGWIHGYRHAALPLHDHERSANAAAVLVELHDPREGIGRRAALELHLVDLFVDRDLVGVACALKRLLENPRVAIAGKSVLSNPRLTGLLLVKVADAFLALEPPVGNDKHHAFQEIGRHVFYDLWRAHMRTVAD